MRKILLLLGLLTAGLSAQISNPLRILYVSTAPTVGGACGNSDALQRSLQSGATNGHLYSCQTSVWVDLGAPATAVVGTTYATSTNCAASTAPATCGTAAAGAFVISAATTSTVVNTSAVTANSEIFITMDDSLGTRLGVTCNTGIATAAFPAITARIAGTSFTVTISGTVAANPLCMSYFILN